MQRGRTPTADEKRQDAFSSNKILGHLPVLNDYVAGNDYAPILVEIDLTNLCASACPWCAGYLNRKWTNHTLFAEGEGAARWESSIRGVKGLLDELAGMGVKAVTWTGGGDPTQHKGVVQAVEHAAGLGLKQGFITHGVVDVQAVLPHLTWIRFSVDAATEEGYGKQHGKPKDFERAIGNIVAAGERKNADSLGVTVGVAFLTSETSWHEIIPFVEMWEDKPIDYIQFRPLQDTHGNEWQSDTPEVISLLKMAKQKDPQRVTWSEPKYWAIARGESGQTERCHGTFLESAIAADSKVYVCCHMKGREEYAIGDLRNESFRDIWKRWIDKREFNVGPLCPEFCRHFGTNRFIEDNIAVEREHPEFI